MSYTYNSRTDKNQKEIVRGLRSFPGVRVMLLHRVGGGCPDILVGYKDAKGNRLNILMEIKTDKGELNPLEKEWHETWTGQVAVIHNLEEALTLIGKL